MSQEENTEYEYSEEMKVAVIKMKKLQLFCRCAVSI